MMKVMVRSLMKMLRWSEHNKYVHMRALAVARNRLLLHTCTHIYCVFAQRKRCCTRALVTVAFFTTSYRNNGKHQPLVTAEVAAQLVFETVSVMTAAMTAAQEREFIESKCASDVGAVRMTRSAGIAL